MGTAISRGTLLLTPMSRCGFSLALTLQLKRCEMCPERFMARQLAGTKNQKRLKEFTTGLETLVLCLEAQVKHIIILNWPLTQMLQGCLPFRCFLEYFLKKKVCSLVHTYCRRCYDYRNSNCQSMLNIFKQKLKIKSLSLLKKHHHSYKQCSIMKRTFIKLSRILCFFLEKR